MLKFLTHKLRTHSLNEDHQQQQHYHQEKGDDDHDSGTESDGEAESTMESEAERSSGGSTVSAATACSPASPYFLDSALPSDSDHNYDHHSSEEELEVICNSLPEKRKWSQVTSGSVCLTISIPPTDPHSSGSSDEEVQGLLQFRTSPPLDAHKPGRSLSPPPKLFHYSGHDVSPRKRHRHTPPRASHIQRPCLDFEKMQQLKARAVTAWRHSGDHGGELSVYCW